MTPEQLRASILQYAMQGKLTDQRPEDGSVDDLLAQIAAEKEQLILDKKIKRDKELPPISEDEVPFQTPAKWKWVRLGEISNAVDYGVTASAQATGNSKFLRITDLTDSGVHWQSVPFVDIPDSKLRKNKLTQHDIVIARTGGTIGKSFLLEDNIDFEAVYASYLIRVRATEYRTAAYLSHFLKSPNYWEQLGAANNGTAQPNVNATSLKSLMLPLPPLAEQERIVDKIDMLETKINEYALRYEKIQLLDSELKPKLRESILYEIAAGKLNSGDTDNSPSSDTDTPFDVPVNWKWVTLSEIAEISLGKTPDSKNARYWAGGKFPWISISDMQNGKVSETTQKQITQAAIDEKMGAISPKGTLILSFKLSIGKVAILPTDMYHNEAIASIFIKDSAVLKEWLYVILPKMVQYAEVAGAVKGNTLNKKKLSNLLIPVPDLETQTKLVHVWSSVQNYI